MLKTAVLRETLPKTFEALCKIHWPRPIHDDVEYRNASGVVDRLAVLAKPNQDQSDFLELLSTLIEKYDKDVFASTAEPHDALETLKYLLEGHDMSASDLGRLLGNRTLGPAILRGDRKISRANAKVLAERFQVNPSLFFQA
jgi:HTH-type transcriptional regulator / antitoxin HigA